MVIFVLNRKHAEKKAQELGIAPNDFLYFKNPKDMIYYTFNHTKIVFCKFYKPTIKKL